MILSRTSSQDQCQEKLERPGVGDLDSPKLQTSLGSRLAKKKLLAIQAALFCFFGLLYQHGDEVLVPTSHTDRISQKSHHKPPTWTNKEWKFTEAVEGEFSKDQKKAISDVCSGRKGVTPPQSTETQASSDVILWTICMTINSGFYDFFRNWYHHYKVLGLNMDLILFAEDPIAYEELLNASFLDMDYTQVVNATNLGPSPTSKTVRAEAPPESSVSIDENDENASSSWDTLNEGADPAWNEGVFVASSYDYDKLISNRPTRLLGILCSGRNVLYIDTDTVLKKNPLPIIDKNYLEDVDISIAFDKNKTSTYDHGSDFCTGFAAFKANAKTIQFLSEWESNCIDDQGYAQNDQYAFNIAYEDQWTEWKESNSSMVKVEGLPPSLFPNGKQYFQLYNENEREQTILVHANWIVGGANKKLSFMNHGLWNPSE